jgi:hypothetical protein
MTLLDQVVAAGPAEQTALPSRAELAAKVRTGWETVQHISREEIAGNLAKMRTAYGATQREMAEETSVPQPTICKLLKWHDAGYPATGPYSRPPVEHQPGDDAGRQPGPGQRQPSAAARTANSLRLEIQDRDAHIAELEAARQAEPSEAAADFPTITIRDDGEDNRLDFNDVVTMDHVDIIAAFLVDHMAKTIASAIGKKLIDLTGDNPNDDEASDNEAGDDAEASAERRKAENAALADDDGSIPTFLRRGAEPAPKAKTRSKKSNASPGASHE